MPRPSQVSPGARQPTSPAQPSVTVRGVRVLWRGLQFGLDLLLMGLICLLPLSGLLLVPRNPDGTVGNLLVAIPMVALMMVTCTAISAFYWIFLPWRSAGRTPGMRVLGLRVVDQSGTAARPAQLTMRWLLLLVDGLACGAVAAVAIASTREGQRVGDLLAGTVVLPSDPPPEPHGGAGPRR